MAALIGILLDVSGSMRRCVKGPANREARSWARSIFKVVDQLVKYDVSLENKVFALGYGAENEPTVFDLLSSVDKASEHGDRHRRTKRQMLDEILTILQQNGAPYVREWAEMKLLEKSVSEEEVKLFWNMLQKNQNNFMTEFVQNCLPVECRERSSSAGAFVAENNGKLAGGAGAGVAGAALALSVLFPPAAPVVALAGGAAIAAGYGGVGIGTKVATEKSIREAVEKGMVLVWQKISASDSRDAIVSVHRASEVLHGCVDEENLTEDQVDKLMKDVEPFIYGGTPMISALRKAKTLMSCPEYEHHHKVLFVLSDGEPADGNTPPDLSDFNVHVVSCYITDSNISDPKRLHCNMNPDWDRGARFMFDLSSSISTQLLPRTIFVKRGWRVDFEDNKTKLFLQVNHPDLIDEVCDFARDVVCCQDVLSDLLTSIDLDLYINKANQGFGAKEQEGGTCYANASAAVLHLAMKRIVGRAGGYPDFFDIRDQLIAKHGVYGADTLRVVQEVCPKYRLHCQEVDIKGALKAVAAKRPVIARFFLEGSKWDNFSDFFERNPKGTLSKEDLDKPVENRRSPHGGHAVVLTSFSSKGLTLMNSWGSDWGNSGFFSVENADVLGLKFVDVYWTLRDLYPPEVQAYEREGAGISQRLMSSLRGLQVATYRCPLCQRESFVREFSGKLVRATCPKCRGEFNTNSYEAHDLVLNMYLTSLVSED